MSDQNERDEFTPGDVIEQNRVARWRAQVPQPTLQDLRVGAPAPGPITVDARDVSQAERDAHDDAKMAQHGKNYGMSPEKQQEIGLLPIGHKTYENLSGTAGTGKTYLSKALIASQPKGRVMLAATTGIAAVNLGEGTTINAALKYFDTESLKQSFLGGILPSILRKHRRQRQPDPESLSAADYKQWMPPNLPTALTIPASIILLDSRTHCVQGDGARCEAR